MPNRMLRDWTDSDKVKGISCPAERFFVRLIMKVDDYGCFPANTSLLKASLFPLMLDEVREADISRWTAECQKAGLIALYEVAGKRYLQIQDFRQRLDRARNKYPLPITTESVSIANDPPPEKEVEAEVEKEVEESSRADLSKSNLFRKPKIPTREEVRRVFSQHGGTNEMADKFFDGHDATGWFYRGSALEKFSSLVPGYISSWRSKEPNSGTKNWMANL